MFTLHGFPACTTTAQDTQPGAGLAVTEPTRALAVRLCAWWLHCIVATPVIRQTELCATDVSACAGYSSQLATHLLPCVAQPAQQQRGAGRRQLRVCAGTVSSNDFKNGMTLEIDGAPWRVQGERSIGGSLD